MTLLEMQIEHWPLDRLLPSPRNARTHTDAQIAEIAGSIKTFGFTNPILVNETGDVIAGHGRLAAARKLALDRVPVISLKHLSELQCRQLMLADNRIALNSGWDVDALKLELADLTQLGADLRSLGFSKNELAAALRGVSTGNTDEDEIPPLGAKAVSRAGDLWLLGSHRLICGDCTDADVVARVLENSKPQLMVTDPPYGVNYDPEWRHRAGVNKSKRVGKVSNDEKADWSQAWALFPGRIAYVWHGALHSGTVLESLTKNGFSIRAQIIWAKERLVIGRGDYHWQHEPCWYAVRERGNWTGDRKQTTLWNISSRDQDTETAHGTQKPVECMRRPMLNNSSAGDAVYEPFLGSGTTLIAAESSGRECLAVELDPVYVDLALRRWEAFSGKQANLIDSGQTFAEVTLAREGEV